MSFQRVLKYFQLAKFIVHLKTNFVYQNSPVRFIDCLVCTIKSERHRQRKDRDREGEKDALRSRKRVRKISDVLQVKYICNK